MAAQAASTTSSVIALVCRVRQSDSGYQFDACLRDKVKLQRAHGGCSGDERR